MSLATYPALQPSRRVLELACPGSDAALREDTAYLVSQRRMTIDDAIEYVRGKTQQKNVTAEPPAQEARFPEARAAAATNTAVRGSPVTRQPPPSPSTAGTHSARRYTGATDRNDRASLRGGGGGGVTAGREAPESGARDAVAHDEVGGSADVFLSDLKHATPAERWAFEEKQRDMMAYEYREDTSMFDNCLSRFGRGQVLFFTTCMTGERAVRDRCRQMENLLHLKLIPHHKIDIADSEFFHRRVRKMYTNATQQSRMPEMPLLFVDDKFIGDFVTVQELEDNGELDEKMLEAGCRVLRQRVVEACQRKRAGLAAMPLVLPRPIASAGAAATATRGSPSISSSNSAAAETSPPLPTQRRYSDKATTRGTAESRPRRTSGVERESTSTPDTQRLPSLSRQSTSRCHPTSSSETPPPPCSAGATGRSSWSSTAAMAV
ncbi:SH3-binding, glutamic acid-rich protein [Novymonas esmeraldas]|uniref:SH3-binding, glutamic acid-rich protein n=1 Tax=Novymonas esmeraldas TaxID=1808958 RepID=A0AAW0EIW4_9TRYP